MVEALIKNTIETCIGNYLESKVVSTTHVLDKIFPVERRIRSIIGGLETSLGTTLWEKLAKVFAEYNGFTILNAKEFNANHVAVPQTVPATIRKCHNAWKDKRELKDSIPLEGYIQDMRDKINKVNTTKVTFGKARKGTGIDLWLKKGRTEYLYDIKTNQVNSGDGNKLNGHLMLWYQSRLIMNPKLNVKCQIAFPFNPHPVDFWKKEAGKVLPLLPSKDAVVGEEFWSFLLGQKGAWKLIEDAFDKLSEEKFGSKFAHVFSNKLRSS